MSWLHSLVHRFGWRYMGHVVSWTKDGRNFVGFQCSTCDKVTGTCDVTRMIDRAIDDKLRGISQ